MSIASERRPSASDVVEELTKQKATIREVETELLRRISELESKVARDGLIIASLQRQLRSKSGEEPREYGSRRELTARMEALASREAKLDGDGVWRYTAGLRAGRPVSPRDWRRWRDTVVEEFKRTHV